MRETRALKSGLESSTKYLRTVLTEQPTSHAIARRLLPCLCNILICMYSSYEIIAAQKATIIPISRCINSYLPTCINLHLPMTVWLHSLFPHGFSRVQAQPASRQTQSAAP